MAEQDKLSVTEKIQQQDANLRQWVGTRIIWTFIGSNIVTLAVLSGLVAMDQFNLKTNLITPDQRIVTEHVIMTLLGATAVQVGVIAGIIARYLFPGRSGDR